MNIIIATTQVPFVRGGAEIHAEGLRAALIEAGHAAEIVSIPFKWYPPERIVDNILACRLLDLTESCGNRIDRVIGLKFPAYLIPHPHKVLWILHQHRSAYELWGSEMCDLANWPNGLQVRDVIRNADQQFIPEARAIFANSANVAARLQTYSGIDAVPLYHPPAGAGLFHCEAAEDYLFFPSRIGKLKRQELVLDALAHTETPVTVWFAGLPDTPAELVALQEKTVRLGLEARVRWLGLISEEEKRKLYARCRGVIFPPFDEDYGYITLEAMLSSKPVVTLSDSGGPLEFVMHRGTGLVAAPTAAALAAALDDLWQHPELARQWGEAGRERLNAMRITWPAVIETLLA